MDDSNLIIDQQSIWPILWSRFIGVYATYHYTDTKIANTKKKPNKKKQRCNCCHQWASSMQITALQWHRYSASLDSTQTAVLDEALHN